MLHSVSSDTNVSDIHPQAMLADAARSSS